MDKYLLVTKRTKAFTLVELSIVIVIIGLVIAGVTAGKSLVRQAQIRGVISDINKIRAGVNSYKLQYDALPGDHATAYNYFGSNCDATPANCNGNGNKLVEASSSINDNELLRIWQHLNLSGLLPGNYTGVASAGGDGNVTTGGVNVPKSPIGNNSSYYIISLTGAGINWAGQAVRNGNIIFLGQDQAASASHIAFLPVIDAYNIDNKYDDGKPYRADILAAHANACTTGSGISGTYQITTTNVCAMGFYLY